MAKNIFFKALFGYFMLTFSIGVMDDQDTTSLDSYTGCIPFMISLGVYRCHIDTCKSFFSDAPIKVPHFPVKTQK